MIQLPRIEFLTVLGKIGRRTLIIAVPNTHPRKCAGIVTKSRAGLTRPIETRVKVFFYCTEIFKKYTDFYDIS